MAALLILRQAVALKQQGISISKFMRKIDLYHNSGEINFTIEDKEGALSALKEYAPQADTLKNTLDFDGYRFEYEDWWFNVRKSNTEPYLRLILEAEDAGVYKKQLAKITLILNKYLMR